MVTSLNISQITNLVLEGAAVKEALSLTEATVDATDMETFVRSPFYKTLEKNAAIMLKKVEDADGYRHQREKDPESFVRDEFEDLEYMMNMFKGLKLVNFPAEVQTPLSRYLRSAANGLQRGEQKLNSFHSPEEILNAFTPLEYTKRALALATDIFHVLNTPWDYDFNWQNYLNDTDPQNSKTPAKRDGSGNREIDYKVPEERLRELAHLVLDTLAEDREPKFKASDYTEEEKACIRAFYARFK